MNITTQPNPTRLTTGGNLKSGSKVAASSPALKSDPKPSSWAGRWTNLAADHTKRWEKRLYTPKSGGVEVGKLAVRIQHKGERDEFRFDTTNRQAAAVQALGVFRFLKANGWKATRTKFKPDAEGQPKLNVTIGDYLGAAERTRKLKARTFDNYRRCLRTIAAEVFGIRPKKSESKYDYRSGGNEAWVKRIDGIRLARLTSEIVNGWKRDRIASAGRGPNAITSANRTVRSYLRCARSLFSRKPDKMGNPGILTEVEKSSKLQLPKVLPFDGVGLPGAGSMEYKSTINVQTLIAAAKNELKTDDAEAYKAFLLGLFAGMRKAEIDSAEWRMLDFTANVLRLEETEWLHLKTRDSADDIAVDPEVMAELRALMPAPTDEPVRWSQFILQSPRAPQPDALRPFYRAEDTFDRLNAWLRRKGIRANKPLHELRKEVGAVIATAQGIYAASKFLRHSDITTTARHYADQKARINVGLGKFLDTTPKPVPAPDQAATA